MIQGKWIPPGQPFPEALALRKAVFVDEQGFSPHLERDDKDDLSWHAVLYLDGIPAATGRIYYFEDAFWVGRICVIPQARAQGLGDLLMRMLLDKAQRHFAPEVRIGAQLPVVPFYARYGFVPTGSVYEEEGVPHQLMRLPGDAIDLRGSCSRDCADCELCGPSAGQDAHDSHDPEPQ